MERYYFDVKIVSAPSMYDNHASYLMKHIHGILRGMAEYAPNIGLSFPEWQPGREKDHVTIGSVVRFVGDKLSIIQMHRHRFIAEISETSVFRVTEVEPVPADAVEVRFVRDRLQEKYYKLKKIDDSIQHSSLNVRLPFFSLKSESNKSYYKVFIRREKADGYKAGEFTRYGLSKDGSTVPVF